MRRPSRGSRSLGRRREVQVWRARAVLRVSVGVLAGAEEGRYRSEPGLFLRIGSEPVGTRKMTVSIWTHKSPPGPVKF
jgi:hypothetical protein